MTGERLLPVKCEDFRDSFVAVHESGLGPKLTCRTVKRMSDVEGEADIKSYRRHFRC
jgi:hypothetical protein